MCVAPLSKMGMTANGHCDLIILADDGSNHLKRKTCGQYEQRDEMPATDPGSMFRDVAFV